MLLEIQTPSNFYDSYLNSPQHFQVVQPLAVLHVGCAIQRQLAAHFPQLAQQVGHLEEVAVIPKDQVAVDLRDIKAAGRPDQLTVGVSSLAFEQPSCSAASNLDNGPSFRDVKAEGCQ